MKVLTDLRQILGEQGVLGPVTLSERAAGIWRQDECLSGIALARPDSTEGVAKILAYCHQNRIPVITQGGLTGLVHGADTQDDAVILSLERMNRIESIQPNQRTLTAQAGVTLAAAQEAAAEEGLIFPLDLGARGSATLGGNAATNAGGNRVLRYGMMRDLVLGVEAVLADGTVINALNGLMKNNAGYDLKQLFLGSEGTLGVITRLTLRLFEAPQTRCMAFTGASDFETVKGLLRHMDRCLGGTLTAFEVLWSDYYALVTSPPARSQPPVPHGHNYYVLLESQGADAELDQQRFQAALESALHQGLIADAAIATSERDCEGFWGIRDDVDQVFVDGPCQLFDVSLPIDDMENYVAEVKQRLEDTSAKVCWVFGHVGDGNLHLAVQTAQSDQGARAGIERCVYEPLAICRGSVSAEHGIGLEKKDWLHISRSEQEINLMASLKRAMDPRSILNPGKVVDT